jgi:glycosyltransferase involved in cell wall biosynthesis
VIHDPAVRVSVIVAVLNCVSTVRQCVDSVLAQDMPEIELIVIDGGSTDGTLKILESYEHRIDFLSSKKDSGVYAAFNRGLEHATGKWICFLGADDFLWSRESLSKLVQGMLVQKDSSRVIYGQIMLLDENENETGLFGRPWSQSSHEFRQKMNIPHVGLLHSKEIFDDHGNFREDFRIAGDYELLLRELLVGSALFVEDVVVAGHRTGGLSTDPKNGLKAHVETWRAQNANGRFLPSAGWILKLPNVLARPVLHRLFGESRGTRIHLKLRGAYRKFSEGDQQSTGTS